MTISILKTESFQPLGAPVRKPVEAAQHEHKWQPASDARYRKCACGVTQSIEYQTLSLNCDPWSGVAKPTPAPEPTGLVRLDAKNILSFISKQATKMDLKNISNDNRWMELPAWAFGLLGKTFPGMCPGGLIDRFSLRHANTDYLFVGYGNLCSESIPVANDEKEFAHGTEDSFALTYSFDQDYATEYASSPQKELQVPTAAEVKDYFRRAAINKLAPGERESMEPRLKLRIHQLQEESKNQMQADIARAIFEGRVGRGY